MFTDRVARFVRNPSVAWSALRRRVARRPLADQFSDIGVPRAPRLGSREDAPDLKGIMQATGSDTDLETAIRYLLDEVSELRALTRHLLAESPRYRDFVRETSDSFNYQWGAITEGHSLRSDPVFLRRCRELVCRYTGMSPEWFAGKAVLDAGCGNGRWAATFCDLGAKVTAFDLSEHGVAETRRQCEGSGATVFRHSVLEAVPVTEQFDLVWSYGVLHHTGDTYRGFRNIVPLVKPGGHLFLMLYGEPRPWERGEFGELNLYQGFRGHLNGLTSEEKVRRLSATLEPMQVHGFFDAVSPPINDCYRRAEVIGWLRRAGFDRITETLDNRNIHMIAQRVTG